MSADRPGSAASCAGRTRQCLRRVSVQRRTVTTDCYQPVVKVRLQSTGAASRLPALLLSQILPVFSLVAPCQAGASPVSVLRRTFTTDC